jgi:hypothetical protein
LEKTHHNLELGSNNPPPLGDSDIIIEDWQYSMASMET